MCNRSFFLQFQDVLENFFSQIRTRGGLCDHPAPINCLNRIRYIILGRSSIHGKQNLNTSVDHDETGSYLVAEVIKIAHLDALKLNENNSTENEIISTDTLSDASSVETTQELTKTIEGQISEDGIEYLSGWVAFKLRSKFPELGTKTTSGQPDHAMLTKPTFVENISYHGLMKPSDKWLKSAQKIHKLFDKFHPPKGFKSGPFIIKRLVNKIMSKHTTFCEPAVRTYVRQRIFARIKKLNNQLKLDQRSTQKKTSVQKKISKLTVKTPINRIQC
jgi:hypothetical protein